MNESYSRWQRQRLTGIFITIGEQVFYHARDWCSLVSAVAEENSVRISILMTDLDDYSASLRTTIVEKWRKAETFVVEI